MTILIEGSDHRPIQIWSSRPPDQAIEQLRSIASQPYVVEHVAAMPDLHVSKGLAVGTVFATEDVIVPSALGGDLGCGMSAMRFACLARSLSRHKLVAILAGLARSVPVGDSVHRGRRAVDPPAAVSAPLSTQALERERQRILTRQLGTLGGGNHFIELSRAADDSLWVLVHSGSRGLGSAIAKHHMRVAENTSSAQIPGLLADSAEGRACIADVDCAFAFAAANHRALLAAAVEVLMHEAGAEPEVSTWVDVHHNFVRREGHFGRQLWVHRKGAISAFAGEKALIPGSMGTASYLVEGRGAPDSFRSASHGAGRVMSRAEARRHINRRRFEHSMRHVVYDVGRSGALVEEAPAAYREIREVLDEEKDLVTPVIRLEPLAVLKG